MQRYFTLMEAMIALGLTAILLGALMHFLLLCTHSSKIADEGLLPELQKSYANHRLSQVLTELAGHQPFSSEEGSSCLFYYNNGIDHIPQFCGVVMSQLWLDSQGRLAHTIWPSPSEWGLSPTPVRTLPLLEGVSQLAFRFYQPPEEKAGEQEEESGWLHHWSEKERVIPTMIQIELEMANGKREKMLFVPTQSDKPILYLVHEENASG